MAGVTAGTAGTRFVIGYWDPAMIMTDWWEPIVVNTTNPSMKVVISTKQEGGYVNAVTMSLTPPNKPAVLQQVMSLFISTSVSSGQTLTLGWTDSAGAKTASVTTTAAGFIDGPSLVSAINSAAATSVESVSSKPTAHGSGWNEYQITFAPNAATDSFKSSLVVSVGSGADSRYAFVTTLTNHDNYPWFYDNPYGYSGSGR
jgi:hypothetical protein